MSSSSHLPTVAAENLAEALNFNSKKKLLRTVTLLPAQPQFPSQPATQVQAPPQLGAAVQGPALLQQQSSQPVQTLGPVSFDPQLGWEGPTISQPLQGQQGNPTNTFTDPVRHVSWGPRTIYYVTNTSTPSSKRKKHSKRSKKSSSKEDVRFEKVVLHGSEQMQTTEKTEILGPEQGGGVRKTWICVTRMVVVSEEREVEAKEVMVESSGGESGTDSDDTDDRKNRKSKGSGGKETKNRKEEVKMAG
ncbi:MAG: hypothetical protein Q9201_003722 [Fulgogasparrea decipioides]